MSETETSDTVGEPQAAEPRLPSRPAGAAVPKVDYLEARIASIEAHVDHMRDDLGDMRRDYREFAKTISSAGTEVRDLDERFDALPGKGWIFMSFVLFTAIICAVLIYLDKIRDYLGILPVTPTP